MKELLLSFDFGGTKLSAALTSFDQIVSGKLNWLDMRRNYSPDSADVLYDIATMIKMGRDLLSGQEIMAVGVSFGGPVDFDTGTVRLSHHVPGWENMPLRTTLEREFGVQVRVDNDANAAALGEYHFGAGRGQDSLFYITVSTGVGGGWVLNGRSWRGHESMAGEIGHTVVDPNGPLCLCGKRGCVERLASGPYMAQDYTEMIGSKVAEESFSGKEVATLAARGDENAQRILLRGARALGIGIGNAANLINPQMFVLGGGVTKSGDLWWETVRHAAFETAMPELNFEIIPAKLGDDAPLWGAVAMLIPQRLKS